MRFGVSTLESIEQLCASWQLDIEDDSLFRIEKSFRRSDDQHARIVSLDGIE